MHEYLCSVFSTAIQIEMLGLQLHPTHSLRMKVLELSLLLDLVTFQIHYQCLWLEVSSVEAEIKLKPSLTKLQVTTINGISSELFYRGEPERAPCSAFNGGNIYCLSICRRTFGRKKFAASIRIRALILHLAGDNLAASMRIIRGSHYI